MLEKDRPHACTGRTGANRRTEMDSARLGMARVCYAAMSLD